MLGSVATGKYVDVLLDVAGERLLFPTEFVGRGDMSRGALLLRAAVHMWVVNVLLFGLWYWQLDGGGPLERPACARIS